MHTFIHTYTLTDGLQPLVEGLHDLEEDGGGEREGGGDVVAEEHLEEGEVGLGELWVGLGKGCVNVCSYTHKGHAEGSGPRCMRVCICASYFFSSLSSHLGKGEDLLEGDGEREAEGHVQRVVQGLTGK